MPTHSRDKRFQGRGRKQTHLSYTPFTVGDMQINQLSTFAVVEEPACLLPVKIQY